MTARLRSEGGFTLIELIVASTLMLIILGATITVFTSFQTNSIRAQDQNAAQDKARNGIDRIARDMRNQATPTKDLPQAIMFAAAADVGFITVGQSKPAGSANDRNLMRVRYCLDTDTRTLWKQTQTWVTPTAPAAPDPSQPCPGGSGWTTRDPIADNVVNGDRAIFTFTPGPPWTTTSDIQAIDTTIFVDSDTTRSPAESRLNTSVRLRNQNRPPTGDFVAKAAGDRHVLLIAGAEDEDGHSLNYEWRVDGALIKSCVSNVCDYGPDDDPPAESGAHTFTLEVTDASGLAAPTITRSVTVP